MGDLIIPILSLVTDHRMKTEDVATVMGSGLTGVRLLDHFLLAFLEDEKLESRGHVIFRIGLFLAASIAERMNSVHGALQRI